LQVLNAKEIRSPIKCLGTTSLFHVRHGEIYVLAVTSHNVDCCLIFEALRKMIAVFRSYFGGKFDEEHIRDNFVLIYELLDGRSLCKPAFCSHTEPDRNIGLRIPPNERNGRVKVVHHPR
jgi:hypothetical protein